MAVATCGFINMSSTDFDTAAESFADCVGEMKACLLIEPGATITLGDVASKEQRRCAHAVVAKVIENAMGSVAAESEVAEFRMSAQGHLHSPTRIWTDSAAVKQEKEGSSTNNIGG